jgi:hypothetical protein
MADHWSKVKVAIGEQQWRWLTARVAWFWLVVMCLLPPSPLLAAPSISWIFPAGAQQGTTVTMTVAGDNLTEVAGVFTTGAGLKATPLAATEPLPPLLTPVKPGEKPPAPDPKKFRQFRVAISQDATLGRQELRVFDRTGASNPRYVTVGDQPEILEREPNDDSAGQLVEPPVVVNGRIQQGGDVDLYTFHGKKGQRIVGEVYGLRSLGMIDDSWLKGYMELRDGAGKVLAASEGYYRWDPLIEYTLPADGDYSFLFRDLLFRGASMAVYRLAIGSLPRVTAIFPPGGRRGSTVDATFIGDNLGPESTRQIAIPAGASLSALEERFRAPTGWSNALPFQVGDLPEVREREPNDGWQQAMPVTSPVTINGRMDRPGDVDSFRFKVAKGQRLVLEVMSSRAESPMDPFLRLLDAKGAVVDENDDRQDRDSRIERTFDTEGDYITQVRDLDERGGETFVYRLTIAPPKPDFSLTATPDKPLVGAGGTAALDLSVERSDGFDGDVAVSVADLPPGLTATQAVIRKGQQQGRLTVTAAEGVPVQALALHVSGAATIGGRTERRLAGTTETYNIQGTAYTRDLTGPIATVGAPVPVSLTAEPGTLSLKGGETAAVTVRAKRRPEAGGEITVRLPNLPEGLTAEPAKIAAGAAETAVTVKAETDVRAAAVNLFATGEVKVGDTTFTATSPAFALAVTEIPGYTVSAEPKELSVAQGGKAEVTVKVTRLGGFDGPIDLQWTFLPSKRSLPAGRIETGRSETKVTLAVPKELSVGEGKAQLTATATIGGAARVREASLKLIVTATKPEGK